MDKSLVVVGGFDDRALEDAEALVQQMMVGIAGFKGLNMIDVEQLLALLILSNFDTPASALMFFVFFLSPGPFSRRCAWSSPPTRIRWQAYGSGQPGFASGHPPGVRVARGCHRRRWHHGRAAEVHPFPKNMIYINKFWAAENRSKTKRVRCKIVSKLKRNMIELRGFQACDVVTHKKLFKVNAFVSGENLPIWFNDTVPCRPAGIRTQQLRKFIHCWTPSSIMPNASMHFFPRRRFQCIRWCARSW